MTSDTDNLWRCIDIIREDKPSTHEERIRSERD